MHLFSTSEAMVTDWAKGKDARGVTRYNKDRIFLSSEKKVKPIDMVSGIVSCSGGSPNVAASFF